MSKLLASEKLNCTQKQRLKRKASRNFQIWRWKSFWLRVVVEMNNLHWPKKSCGGVNLPGNLTARKKHSRWRGIQWLLTVMQLNFKRLNRLLLRLQLVFPKRSAMLLDRLMVALHHALEDEDPKEINKIKQLYHNGQLPLPSTINPNLTPKYYKGKSDSDAYYGYKLLNGQTGELKTNQLFYWC